MGDAAVVADGLRAFQAQGAFSEEHYAALRRLVLGVGRVQAELLDGFVGLFFERHVLDDTRLSELLALPEPELERAVRHRFKQVVAGGQDSHQAWHALAAHVRDALTVLMGPGASTWPASLTSRQGFSAIAVEQAVATLWAELGRRPTPREATQDLFGRYVTAPVSSSDSNAGAREFPAVVVARLDAQRLARAIVGVLSDDERDLLRSQLDGQPVDEWATGRGVSRATAYRMLARIKALCRVEFDQRSSRTQLEVLDVLRGQL